MSDKIKIPPKIETKLKEIEKKDNKKNNKKEDEETNSSEEQSDGDIIEKDANAPMGYAIKRKKSKDLVHKSKLLKNNSNFIMVTGATGSGKSTIVLQLLLCFSKKVKYILLASAKIFDDAHESIKKYCKKEDIIFNYVHDADECNNKLADILDEKKKDDHVIVIFDDFNANFNAQGNDPLNQIIIKVFSLLRSQNCSAFVITQTYYSVATKVRENCNIRIVFKMDNVHSHRALINDIEGLFYNGDNEHDVRKDLKVLYNKIFSEPYKFLLILSHPPPQIRIGWHDIVYPPDQVGHVEGGEMKTKKKREISKPIKEKHALYRIAVDLGMPRYLYKKSTLEQIKKWIEIKTSKAQLSNGNTAPELEKILSGEGFGEETVDKLRGRLQYNIRRYKAYENPRNISAISEICNKLVDKGMPIDQVRYLIRSANMDEHIEL